MRFSTQNILSRLCIWVVLGYCLLSFISNKRWEKNPIVWDVVSYYGYLPAAFIYNDITLQFIDKDPVFFKFKYWPEHAPNGGRVIKTTMGLSYLYAPFFFIGHVYAGMAGEPQDGFSLPYQIFLQVGSLFYLIGGLLFLRSLLLKYFRDFTVAVTIVLVVFGTNLLNYATGESLLAHVYIFSIACVFLWAVDGWHSKPGLKLSFVLGLTGGLLTVMRPTLLLFLLFPLLYGVTGPGSLKEKIQLLKYNSGKLIIIVLAFCLPGIPQLLYWKYITGAWFFFSYTGEKFFWDNPHILQGLFGYRNGWLLYTPVMTFGIIGMLLMREKAKAMKLPAVIMLAAFIYSIHSWWCWWHGGYGVRAYIDIYALLALPMASFFEFFTSRKIFIRVTTLIVASALIALNIFQTWQYQHTGIHFDSMTRQAYWLGFLKTEVPAQWWYSLRKPNYDRALEGLPEDEEYRDAVYHFDKIMDFETLYAGTDSGCYSSLHALTGENSFMLKRDNNFSPRLSIQAAELSLCMHGKTISTKFFFETGSMKKDEYFLIISFIADTGIYHHEVTDFFEAVPKPGGWNTLRVRLNQEKIRESEDRIEIYLQRKNSEREIFVDDMAIETVCPKD